MTLNNSKHCKRKGPSFKVNLIMTMKINMINIQNIHLAITRIKDMTYSYDLFENILSS